MEPVKKLEKLDKFELTNKGKLILSHNLQAEIDLLHKKVGNIEWIGVLFYTKVAGDIGNPSTLVLKADRLFLMDIGTAGHTEATMDAEEVLNMYDQIPDCMNLKQGLIHTHHNMAAFFSGEDWDELQINTPVHHYYLSLIVNHAGTYVAKVAYVADSLHEFKYRNSNNEDETSRVNKKLMMVIDLDIIRETADIAPYFVDRYNYVKEKVDAAKKTTYHWNGAPYQGPYHTWPQNQPKEVAAPTSKKEDQGEVGQESTFPLHPANPGKGKKDYYRKPSDTLTYKQAREICLDWLNEGLRLEVDTKDKFFTSLPEGLTWFSEYFHKKRNTEHYTRWITYMQQLLVDVSAEYQPSVTAQRVGIQMSELAAVMASVDASAIATDLATLAKAHPTYLSLLRKLEKEPKKKGNKVTFVDPWGREIE